MVGKKKAGKKDTPDSESKKSAQDSKQKQQKKSDNKSGPNTGPIYYLSNKKVAKKCKNETNQIKKACDDDKAASKKQAKAAQAQNAKLGKLTDKVKEGLASVEGDVKTLYGYERNANNAWIEEHCDGLWIKPMAGKDGFDNFIESLDKVRDGLEDEVRKVFKKAGIDIAEMAKEKAVDYAEKALLREGAALTALAVPVAGEVIVLGVTAWNVIDGIWTAGSAVVKTVTVGKAAFAKYQELKPQLNILENMLSRTAADKITPSTVLAEMMTVAAAANPCIQARRCVLVPFEETEKVPKRGEVEALGAGAAQARSGKGCCPGQTGHHVLPGAMFGGENGDPCAPKDKPDEKVYDHKKALVICAEGTGNRVGSHGEAHIALDDSMKQYKITGGETISYEKACAQGIDAVRRINPACSEKCFKAQLDAHYKDKLHCADAKLNAHSGMGGAPAGKLPKEPKPVKKPKRAGIAN